jgi:hypothetical protein
MLPLDIRLAKVIGPGPFFTGLFMSNVDAYTGYRIPMPGSHRYGRRSSVIKAIVS